jgi:hypothetical protein
MIRPSPLAQDIMVACMVPTVHAKLSEVAASLIEAAAYILVDVPEPKRSQITTEARARLTKLLVTPP